MTRRPSRRPEIRTPDSGSVRSCTPVISLFPQTEHKFDSSQGGLLFCYQVENIILGVIRDFRDDLDAVRARMALRVFSAFWRRLMAAAICSDDPG